MFGALDGKFEKVLGLLCGTTRWLMASTPCVSGTGLEAGSEGRWPVKADASPE